MHRLPSKAEKLSYETIGFILRVLRQVPPKAERKAVSKAVTKRAE